MILRILGLGILLFVLLCGLPFFFFPLWPFGNLTWLALLSFIGFGIYLLAHHRRAGQLVLGMLLFFVGLAFLSHNLWDFDLFRFWPLILIAWGLTFLLEKPVKTNPGRPAQ